MTAFMLVVLIGFVMASVITRYEERPAPKPAVESAQADPCEGFEAGESLDEQEQEFLRILNEYRVTNGLSQLSVNVALTQATNWMSQDMAAKDYFSHTDSLGHDPFERMDAFGYNYNTWKGENLAAGGDTAEWALDLWKNSPGHNANMLNPNFKVIGIARGCGPNATYGWYWATDFGGYQEPPPVSNS
jgi:uncharacterized protein YkwD